MEIAFVFINLFLVMLIVAFTNDLLEEQSV